MTRIAILGAGALGSVFGGYLSAADEDVVFVDIWTDHIECINQSGLYIERPDREDLVVEPNATTNADTCEAADVLFVFVKSYHTREALETSDALYDDDTTVVTLQNGLLNLDYIQDYVPSENVVGGATTIGSSMEGPGHVLHTGWGDTTIGGYDETRVATVAELLTDAGIETSIHPDPRAIIWKKQFVSVGIKPVAALTGLLDGPLSDVDEAAHVMERLVEEAVTIATAKGIEITGDPVAETHRTCKINYGTKSSMLEDVENERQTEIDQINGAIVKYADELDIEVPYNRIVTNLVKAKERSYSN